MESLFDVAMNGENLSGKVDGLFKLRKSLEEYLNKAKDGDIHFRVVGDMVHFTIRDSSGCRASLSPLEIGYYMQKLYYRRVYNFLKFNLVKNMGLERYYEIRLGIQKIYYDFHEDLRKFIAPVDVSNEECGRCWLMEDYEHSDKPFNDENNYAKNNVSMRSKSEVLIGNGLIDNGKLFKYECPYWFGDGTRVFPDFTIWDEENRREIIWEHFGMCGNPEYVATMIYKINKFIEEGWFLGENLLCTFELDGCALNTHTIEMYIKKYLKGDKK